MPGLPRPWFPGPQGFTHFHLCSFFEMTASSFSLRLPLVAACVAVSVAGLFPGSARAGVSGKNPKQPDGPGAEPWEGRSRFYFSAGWMWRETEGVDFRGGSRSQQLTLPRLWGGGHSGEPSIGSAGEYGDRFYRDGSVRMDAGTALDGTTSAWSYQDASQVSGGALHYHAEGRRRTAGSGRHFQEVDSAGFDASGGAPVIELGWERELTPAVSLGARFQWSFLDFDGSHTQSNFSAWQQGRDYAISYTDTYALGDVIPPEAPYDGAGLGFGPLIDNIPASRQGGERSAGGGGAHFFNRVHQSFEVKLHTFSLGPVVSGRMGPVSLQGGAGLALNVADWEAEQAETLYLSRNGGRARAWRRWTDRGHDTEVLPGFYLQGGVSWQVTDRIFINGFARYDWSEALEEKIGPAVFSFDPSGWSAGVLVGISF